MNVEAFRDRHGTAEFDCPDCGAHVHSFVHHGEPVCHACKLIREHPEWSDDFKAIVRGGPATQQESPMKIPMRIDVHHHFHTEPDAPGVSEVLVHMQGAIETMSKALEDLAREVGETTTVVGSAVALIQGLKQKLDEAGTDPDKLAALSAELDTGQKVLADAIAANTPAATDTAGDAGTSTDAPTGDDTSGGAAAAENTDEDAGL